ncbi:MAG: phosphatidylglycerophosphatase A [Breznakia sp.]
MKENGMFEKCIRLLEERGVHIQDIVDCVIYLQKNHLQGISEQEIRDAVINVIGKREVQHAIITGVCLDKMSEEHVLCDKELEDILNQDESLYGIDEVLAYGICNLYGSIALTNYGFIDRDKFGIIEKLNDDIAHCHVFLDDIVGAIAASAASRLAHGSGR